jgi:hypothetical protein
MVKDRIKELVGEAAGGQRIANGNKRHLRTWLVAVIHLWSPSMGEPIVSGECSEAASAGMEDHEQEESA